MNVSSSNERLVGDGLDAIETPALVVDLSRLEANLDHMAGYFSNRQCRLRPHFKSHKCVELARRQLAAGNASGVTCAKLSEAEVLVAGGIRDVLIANQVVGAGKAQRLAELNRNATVRCAVDSAENVHQLGGTACNLGVTIPVLVETDVGMDRCGVPPGEATVALAQRVAETPGLRFDGLQGYEGHLVCLEDAAERASRTREAMALLVETRRQLEQCGPNAAIVSSGGTGTYDITGNIKGIDEVQSGSYALMDWSYRRVRSEFQVARWVLTTVISARPDQAVVDVGLKGVGCDFGHPIIEGHPEAVARYTAEEHVPFDHLSARVGDRLRLVPSHGCTTHHLYREMFVIRDEAIVDVWEIEGAGCLT